MPRVLPSRKRKPIDIAGKRRVKIAEAPGLGVQVHLHTIKDVFTDQVVMDMKPILDLARALGTKIRQRVLFRGVNARGGRFSPYPTKKKRKTPMPGKQWSGKKLPLWMEIDPYWAPGHYPQGPSSAQLTTPTSGGGKTTLKSKKHPGARAYMSRRHYQVAIAGQPKKKFKIMGQFWKGLKVRPVRAGYVKLAFFKSSYKDALKKKKVANRTKAAGMNKHETISILHPSKSEMKWANEYVRLFMTSAFLNPQGAQELRIKAFKAAARIEKQVRSFSKRFGGR